MIDLRELRDDPDRFRASQRARGEDAGLVDQVRAADERRRSSAVRFDTLRAEQKSLGKLIPKAAGDEKAELLRQANELAAAVKAADAEQNEAAEQARTLALSLSNLLEDGVPEGGEEDFAVLEHVGTPRDFAAEGFEPRDHVELGR
ncbi:MAG TPA: serine--tRNA ligase, partial [Trebonia sp.]|nr:serine--tRNA ligase [Trebonia sp.]